MTAHGGGGTLRGKQAVGGGERVQLGGHAQVTERDGEECCGVGVDTL